jgi:hypothetical protein
LFTIDKHTLALISIIGSAFDLLGALYLAYDLLGGEHGPLRTLTRAVTYAVVFGTGYGLAMGPIFGVVTGAAHGITLGWEFSRLSRHKPEPGFWQVAAVSGVRGLGFGLGTAALFGARFGITFGLLSTVGQMGAYRIGISPTLNLNPSARPRLTRFQLLTALNRTLGYTVAGYICSLVAHRTHAIEVGLKAGLTIGLVTALSVPFTPFIEQAADRVPAKRMGVTGVGLILIGFTLQSLQYWVTLLDVAVS